MNKDNYFFYTIAVWIGCNRPNRKPDYISYDRDGNVSSEYWYTPLGVIRCSNHWSRVYTPKRVYNSYTFECKKVGTCYWVLRTSRENTTCGFCRWEDFRDNKRNKKWSRKTTIVQPSTD